MQFRSILSSVWTSISAESGLDHRWSRHSLDAPVTSKEWEVTLTANGGECEVDLEFGFLAFGRRWLSNSTFQMLTFTNFFISFQSFFFRFMSWFLQLQNHRRVHIAVNSRAVWKAQTLVQKSVSWILTTVKIVHFSFELVAVSREDATSHQFG